MDSIEQSTRAYSQLKPAALAILCLGVIVAQVDTSVVNLAVQPIGLDLKASVTELQWVVDAYNLVYAAFLISGGLFADLYGRRLMFMIGCAVFALASLACAFASTIAILIAARSLTGFGSALLLPASLSLIRVIYRDEKVRARALGIWAGCNGMALAIDPSLRGFLIRDFGWRSVFFVVIPIALIAAAAARLLVPESADRQGRSFDMPGQLLGIASLTLLTLTAIESSHLPPLWTALLAIAGALLLLLFVIVEKRLEQTALVPISMFSGGQFRGAMAGTAAMTFGMYGTLFLFPLAALGLGRLTSVEVGLSLLPMALSFIVISPFSGSLSGAWEERHHIGRTGADGSGQSPARLILSGRLVHCRRDRTVADRGRDGHGDGASYGGRGFNRGCGSRRRGERPDQCRPHGRGDDRRRLTRSDLRLPGRS